MAVSLQEDSKRRTEANRKAVSGILIAFYPILGAIMLIILSWTGVGDIDEFFIFLILISPICFIVGAVKSALSFKGPGGKTLPMIGLIVNGTFLVIGIYLLMTVKVN